VLGRRRDTTITEELPGYLRVELRTFLFVDDGEFLLNRSRNVIQTRSASRIGYSDLGKNRNRAVQQCASGEGFSGRCQYFHC
jgi:uncharacterized protein (DUF1499 family)